MKKFQSLHRLLMNSSTLFALIVITLLSSCKDDDPEPANEEELITTVTLTFQKLNEAGQADGSAPLSFTWEDADGAGSGSPVIDDITLDAHSTYRLTLGLSDDSKTPPVDIAEEIEEEDEEHQFFFDASGFDAIITYDDEDDNGKPVGLVNTFATDHEGSGTFTVILRHEPNKDAAGVADGDIANAGGDTDIEAEFEITIVE
jgi:hypothetical protein